MAYENIRFRKSNMTIADGYFYFFDADWDTLTEKVDDGDVSFVYPLDTAIGGGMREVHYDGANFWTLQNYGPGGIVIRRWRIESNRTLVKIKDEFIFANDGSNTYEAYAFGIEHYITSFNCTVSGGETTLCLSKYYDTTAASGVVLTLGPNDSDETEGVNIISVSGTDVVIASGTQYAYESGDQISFYKSLFVFNNFFGTSAASGTLFEFDGYTGALIAANGDTEYQDIDAAVFGRVRNALTANPDIDTLIYVKSTNAKLLNISNLTTYGVAIIDNVQTDNSTVITVYDMAIYGRSLYRLQDEGTLFGTNNDWGSQYNYVVTPLRSFIDSITVTAFPTILPANGTNISEINATVLDQYGKGVIFKPVDWTDTDVNGYITITPSFTDVFFGTGLTVTYYRAGVIVQQVTVEGTATQYD